MDSLIWRPKDRLFIWQCSVLRGSVLRGKVQEVIIPKFPGRNCMPFFFFYLTWESILSNSVCGGSQKPTQVQEEGTEAPPLHGRSIRAFVPFKTTDTLGYQLHFVSWFKFLT